MASLNFQCAVKRRRSTAGGNETAEASGVESRFRRLGKSAGRNGSEPCAGPETGNAVADPPEIDGRPQSTGRSPPARIRVVILSRPYQKQQLCCFLNTVTTSLLLTK